MHGRASILIHVTIVFRLSPVGLAVRPWDVDLNMSSAEN